jgi:hypothetical protein
LTRRMRSLGEETPARCRVEPGERGADSGLHRAPANKKRKTAASMSASRLPVYARRI